MIPLLLLALATDPLADFKQERAEAKAPNTDLAPADALAAEAEAAAKAGDAETAARLAREARWLLPAPPAGLPEHVRRVFGAGRTLGGDGKGGPGELMRGKRLVSLSSSGSMRAWLDEKGVLGSLRTVFDRYLAEVFGFVETHHHHFDGITDKLTERDLRLHLHDAEKAANEVVSRMVGGPPERHPNRR